jgi:hypothetical protein
MESLTDIRHRLRATRTATLAILANIDDGTLERPIPWRDRPSDVRSYLLGLAERDDQHRVLMNEIYDNPPWRPGEAARLLAVAQEVHGQLRGVLVGVPDDLLDRAPARGEWSLRQVLSHVEQIAERYLLQTAYAVERVHSEQERPLRIPEERLPPTTPSTRDEPLTAILAAMDEMYDRVDAQLAGIASADMAAPTLWAGWSVDVRFRLLRFAAHERQHLVHAAKTLTALGFRQTETQMILGQAEIARGALIGRLAGLPDELLHRTPADRKGSAPPSVAMLLAQAAGEEQAIVELIWQHLA